MHSLIEEDFYSAVVRILNTELDTSRDYMDRMDYKVVIQDV